MFLLNAFIHFLTGMFLIGLAGSAIVVTLAFVEDIGVLFGRDADPEGLSADPASTGATATTQQPSGQSAPARGSAAHAVPRS